MIISLYNNLFLLKTYKINLVKRKTNPLKNDNIEYGFIILEEMTDKSDRL